MTKTDEQRAEDERRQAQDRQWRSAALSQAASNLSESPTATPEDRQNANRDLLKLAEDYYKFFSEDEGVQGSDRAEALRMAATHPLDGTSHLTRAKEIFAFLTGK